MWDIHGERCGIIGGRCEIYILGVRCGITIGDRCRISMGGRHADVGVGSIVEDVVFIGFKCGISDVQYVRYKLLFIVGVAETWDMFLKTIIYRHINFLGKRRTRQTPT